MFDGLGEGWIGPLEERLHRAELLSEAALSMLDLLRHGVLILDADGVVLHANTEAAAVLAVADGLGAFARRLHGIAPGVTNRLHEAIRVAGGVAGGRDGIARAVSLRAPKRSGGVPLALLVAPFRGGEGWALAGRPAVLVCVTDLDRMRALPVGQLVDLFGLTRAEAGLAISLAAGESLADVAARQGRSVNTMRTHPARLMSKTGVNRQSSLARLLAVIPAEGEG